jgi:hypothetical protein
MKTYKAYLFGLTLIALAVASCSKDEIAAKLVPDKPTIVRKDGCLDAGLPGAAYFKVLNHTEKQTYRWNIDPLFGAQDTDYSNPYDPPEIKVNTLGNVGTFTVTAVAANSYGNSEESEPLSVNVNKDDFPYTIVAKGNEVVRYYYTFEDGIATDEDIPWYLNHDAKWIYNGQDVTANVDYVNTPRGIYSRLLITATDTFYVTVTNLTTGCKVRKTAGANGFE